MSDMSEALPRLTTWKEYRRTLEWEGPSSRWGSHVGSYANIVCDEELECQMWLVPQGQARASRSLPLEAVVVGVAGSLELRSGDLNYDVEPLDTVTLGPETHFDLANVGLNSGIALLVTSKAIPTTSEEGLPISRLAWSDTLRRFNWGVAVSEEWGYHRASGPHLSATAQVAHLVRQPPGQSCPWHQVSQSPLVPQSNGRA